MSICGNTVGGILTTPNTIILVTEDGHEYPAVATEEEVVLTASTNDLRLGKTAILDSGVEEGQKDIPAYHTSEGCRAVPSGEEITIRLKNEDAYDYTKLQAILCSYNTTVADSVSAEKVAIEDKVYRTNSTIPLASITLDHDNKKINFGVTNTSDNLIIVRYFTYKEEK